MVESPSRGKKVNYTEYIEIIREIKDNGGRGAKVVM